MPRGHSTVMYSARDIKNSCSRPEQWPVNARGNPIPDVHVPGMSFSAHSKKWKVVALWLAEEAEAVNKCLTEMIECQRKYFSGGEQSRHWGATYEMHEREMQTHLGWYKLYKRTLEE